MATATRTAPLHRPADGLAAKVALIDDADATLDLQYYQWDHDDVGLLLLDRLLELPAPTLRRPALWTTAPERSQQRPSMAQRGRID